MKKLLQPTFRNFLEKYTDKSIPDQSTLRKTYVNKFYKDTLCEIKTYALNENIWISIDTTTIYRVIKQNLNYGSQSGKQSSQNSDH